MAQSRHQNQSFLLNFAMNTLLLMHLIECLSWSIVPCGVMRGVLLFTDGGIVPSLIKTEKSSPEWHNTSLICVESWQLVRLLVQVGVIFDIILCHQLHLIQLYFLAMSSLSCTIASCSMANICGPHLMSSSISLQVQLQTVFAGCPPTAYESNAISDVGVSPFGHTLVCYV